MVTRKPGDPGSARLDPPLVEQPVDQPAVVEPAKDEQSSGPIILATNGMKDTFVFGDVVIGREGVEIGSEQKAEAIEQEAERQRVSIYRVPHEAQQLPAEPVVEGGGH